MSQQDFTEIVQTKKRFTVVVSEEAEKSEQCQICKCYLQTADFRHETFICPVCNRECCADCTPYEYYTTHFPMHYVCDDCDVWSVEDQLKIAAFTAEMNK